MAEYNPYNLDEFLRGPGTPTLAVPAAPASAGTLPWYNRPLPVPPWLSKLGRGARVLGRAAGPVGAGLLLGEGYLRGIDIAANMIAGGPTVQGTVEQGRAGFGAMPVTAPTMLAAAPAPVAAPAAAPSAEPVVPEVLATPENLAVPPRGTGFFRNNMTGRVMNFDVRGQPVPAAPRPTGNFAGDFTGALLRLRQVSGDNALKAAQAKAAAANLAARGTAARGAAALGITQASLALAEEARAQGATPAELSAILHGSSQGGGGVPFRESTTTLPDVKTGAVTVIDARTGKARRVIPTPPVQDITLAEAVASAKLNKTYKSDAQVRTDLAKLPGYRLVD